MKTKARIAFVSAAILGAATLLAPSPLKAQATPPADYVKAVYAKVAQATVYPKMAKLRGQEGKVGCIVKISPTGELVDGSVESSSGTPALDEAASRTQLRAQWLSLGRPIRPPACLRGTR